MNKKILICGHRSFVAAGLSQKLAAAGYHVDCFTRGEEGKTENKVTGDVFNMTSNSFLDSAYDVILNFILIKDESIERNIAYIKELIDFCKSRSVDRLIHISSLMVYDNNEAFVNEHTKIERDTEKEGYANLKIETDRYLNSLRDIPFQITFVRLGYVIAEDRPIPYILPLAAGVALIKGGKNSKEPVVHRSDVHRGIIKMLKLNVDRRVLLFVPAENKTKYGFAKEQFGYRYLFIPKWFVLNTAALLSKAGVLSRAFYKRVEGMFSETDYDPTETEKLLSIKF